MLVDGQKIAREIVAEIKSLAGINQKSVCFVSFSASLESQSFIKTKSRTAESLGIKVTTRNSLAKTTNEALDFLKTISEENYDGVVVQLPLPENLDLDKIFAAIPLDQDIDMLSEKAKLLYKELKTKRTPPVAAAVEEILAEHSVNLENKNILVLGQGRLVGEPISMMLTRKNISHKSVSKESDQVDVLQSIKEADVILSGMGSPHFIKPGMVKSGVVIIDAGTSESAGKLVGDADPSVKKVASLFTPVPGGVGPITVACLYRNLFLK